MRLGTSTVSLLLCSRLSACLTRVSHAWQCICYHQAGIRLPDRHGSCAVCTSFPCKSRGTAPGIPDSVYHTAGLVYPGVGWVIWRNRACVDESLIFKIDYLVSLFLS